MKEFAPFVAIAISLLSFVGGLISHFFIVVKEITILKTELKHAKDDIISLKEHLPKIEEKLSNSNTLLTSLNSKFEILVQQK